MMQQILSRYKRRPDWQCCPVCGRGVKWLYDGTYWYPCDEKPVLFKRDSGYESVIARTKGAYERLYNCKILHNMDGITSVDYGLEQHYFKCKGGGTVGTSA